MMALVIRFVIPFTRTGVIRFDWYFSDSGHFHYALNWWRPSLVRYGGLDNELWS